MNSAFISRPIHAQRVNFKYSQLSLATRHQSRPTKVCLPKIQQTQPLTVCHSSQGLSPTADGFRRVSQLTLLVPFVAALTSTPLGALYGPTFTEAGRVSLMFLIAALIPNAVALNCLQEAAQKGRTSTPTYTRLNSALQLTIIGGIVALTATVRDGIAQLGAATYFKMIGVHATTAGCVIFLLLLARACKGFFDIQKAVAEKNVMLDTLRLLVSVFIHPLVFWSSFMGGMFSALTWQMLFLAYKHTQSHVSGVLRAEQLWLITLMAVPITACALLKDAADRNRLAATTYRKLSISLVAMGMVHLLGAVVWNQMGGPFSLPSRMFVTWTFVICVGGYSALCGDSSE